mgnify:CR=1 FL=1
MHLGRLSQVTLMENPIGLTKLQMETMRDSLGRIVPYGKYMEVSRH